MQLSYVCDHAKRPQAPVDPLSPEVPVYVLPPARDNVSRQELGSLRLITHLRLRCSGCMPTAALECVLASYLFRTPSAAFERILTMATYVSRVAYCCTC